MNILIKNANALMMIDDKEITTDILIENGKIKKIAEDIQVLGDETIIDAQNNYVTPGFIDPHSHVGIFEEGIGREGSDGNEKTDPVTPNLDGIYAVNPMGIAFEDAYKAGVTAAVTGPGSANVIGGTYLAVKTYGQTIDDMLIRTPTAMKSALGENPKTVYGALSKAPTTRMSIAALFRETLLEAKDYFKTKEENSNLPKKDFKLEALKDVIDGRLILKTHAHRADDIVTAIRIAKEFGLKMTIEHCTEGHLIADYLKEANIPVTLGPLMASRPKIELKNQSMKAPAILEKAGVGFAIMSDHPVIPIQYLPVQAAVAVREGLSPMAALKAITINAAKFNDIDDRVGSLEEGKDADIVIWSGYPLDWQTKPLKVLIDGKVVYEE